MDVFCEVLLNKLPDMDDRDRKRGENLLAEAVASSFGVPGADEASELSRSLWVSGHGRRERTLLVRAGEP
eukprot:373458-Amphidinium_carterae.1